MDNQPLAVPIFFHICWNGDTGLYDTFLQNAHNIEQTCEEEPFLQLLQIHKPIRVAPGYLPRPGLLEALLRDPQLDPSSFDNNGFCTACRRGHIHVVRTLLSDRRICPHLPDNFPLLVASYGGHSEIVRMLLNDPRLDCQSNNNEALRIALWRGHIETWKLLLGTNKVTQVVLAFKRVIIPPADIVNLVIYFLSLTLCDFEPEIWLKKFKILLE